MLRDYQQKAIADVIAAYKSGHQAPVLVIPTGGGKTHVATDFIQNLVDRGKQVWFAVHSDTLIKQTHRRLVDVLDVMKYPVGIVKSGHPVEYQAPVQMVSIQSWRSRADKLSQPDLIICDEAHRSAARSWQTFLNHYPSAKRLGLTATPCRFDGKGMDTAGYDVLVQGPQTKELLEQGHLCPFDYKEFRLLSSEGVKKVRGEYSTKELGRKFDPQDYGPVVVKQFLDHELQPTLFFAMLVQHGLELMDLFAEAGIRGQWFDADTPVKSARDSEEATRSEMLANIERCWRDYPLAGNVGLFTEGMDLPVLVRDILLRPTGSTALFLQMCGRALRNAPCKDRAEIWDFAGNAAEHGYPDDVRHWTLEGLISIEKARLMDMKPADRKRRNGAAVVEFIGLPEGTDLALEVLDKTRDDDWWLRWLSKKLVPIRAGYAKPAMIMMALKTHTKDAPWPVWKLAMEIAHTYSQARSDVKTLSHGWARALYKERHGRWPDDGQGVVNAHDAKDKRQSNSAWLEQQKKKLGVNR